MIVIDCAGDNKIAQELASYLNNHGFEAREEESLVIVNEEIADHILYSFLENTSRSDYTVRKIDSTNFVVAKEVPIEYFGFLRCEMCGFLVPSEEELMVHRRAHGIQLL